MVKAEILKNRPVRGGRVLPVEASDFASKSALFLPREAQYEYLVNLPADIASAGLTNQSGHTMNSLGEVVNNAMELVETGHVDVMVSVGNNFFYTKSLPCSLWFFDKGKGEELRDKVLFLDARNYYGDVITIVFST